MAFPWLEGGSGSGQGDITVNITETQITQAAARICHSYAGSDCSLTLADKILPDDWGRNLVWRYRVTNGPASFPDTVIVKTSKIGDGHIFDEWASLQFLNQFEALDRLVPAFYGGDEELKLLVLEDLGAIRGRHDLGSLLEGEDPAIAKEALLAHARNMALLHVTTAGSKIPTLYGPSHTAMCALVMSLTASGRHISTTLKRRFPAPFSVRSLLPHRPRLLRQR